MAKLSVTAAPVVGSTLRSRRGDSSTLSAFVRWTGRSFLCLLRSDADLLQERLDGLFPAKEFLDGNVYLARIAHLVNFAAQFHAGLFIEVTVLRFFKNCRHVGGDGIRPGVAVVTGVVPVQMSKVGDERRARIDGQKDFFQNRIRYGYAIV